MSSANAQDKKTVLLALTGASGMPYARRLLAFLLQQNITVWLLYSKAAQTVAMQECDWLLPAKPAEAEAVLTQEFGAQAEQLRVFGKEDWFAPPASGSNPPDAMVMCPASMGAVAAVAHGMADNLIERAADVCLKEKRPLLIVPREMPFSTLHLRNLLQLSECGATIIPPQPAFYHHPQGIEDMIDFVVARILDHLHITHDLLPKWGA
ncbi:MAG: flavin prenyltransferase UbiX [Neisseria sp.]|nr:flavin prenyltransferase UbiX [Neisseria sp.]